MLGIDAFAIVIVSSRMIALFFLDAITHVETDISLFQMAL
jgi:hypothetical protein